MKKKVILNTILFILFVAGLVALLFRANYVLRQKDYSGVQDNFAKLEKDSMDIIFVGTSHQFCTIDPDLLYEEYGIESFMLATSAQTVPMSYYAVMEAIELQHPEKIVFEVCYCANDFRTVTEEMSHCFFDGMPNCEARTLGLDDLIEEENRIYYDLPIGLYHTRWKELDELDYLNNEVSARGGVHYEDVVANWDIPLISPEEKEPMPEEMEKYMNMMVSLCRENDVELIFYVAPFNGLYQGEEEAEQLYRRQRIFNYISDYAEENGVAYYNLFYEIEEMGIDNATDWKDTQHFNCNGQEKVTRYMVENGYF